MSVGSDLLVFHFSVIVFLATAGSLKHRTGAGHCGVSRWEFSSQFVTPRLVQTLGKSFSYSVSLELCFLLNTKFCCRLPVSVKFDGKKATPILVIVYGCLRTTAAELGGCNRVPHGLKYFLPDL